MCQQNASKRERETLLCADVLPPSIPFLRFSYENSKQTYATVLIFTSAKGDLSVFIVLKFNCFLKLRQQRKDEQAPKMHRSL